VWNPAAPLRLTRKQQTELETLIGQGKTPQRVALRAMIVLASAEGKAVNAIAHEFSVARPTVYLWRRRFEDAGVQGLLKDAPRAGRRPALMPERIAAVVL
jgi:transposase